MEETMATIRKRGDAYQIRVSTGYDTNGRHKEQAMTWKPEPGMTEKQIKKELNRQAVMFEEKCAHGYCAKAIKFQDLAEEWFEQYAAINLRHTTYDRLSKLRKRIYSAIGHLRIDKLSTRQLQAFVNSMAQEGANMRNGKPLAPKTIRHHLSLISDIYSYAVRMDMVSDNPCSRVVIPKGEVKEKEIYTQEEMMQLLELLMKEPLKYRTFFFLIAYSGFRRSEMLGLEWKDIDWENNLISVRRTSNYVPKIGIYTDTTKTRYSQRTIKLADEIMDMLREWQDEQAQQALAMGDKWVETDRIFTRPDGRPLDTNGPYSWLKKLCEENELPFYGIHTFRHFTASSMIAGGMDVATVSGALGHANVSTTLNVYTHQFQTAQARVYGVMNNVFGFRQAAAAGA